MKHLIANIAKLQFSEIFDKSCDYPATDIVTLSHFSWTDLAQAIAAIVGILFLVLNLQRTNKMIKLQSDAIRNSTLPRLKADFMYDHLPQSIQKDELSPVAIYFIKEEVYNLTITFKYNEHLDLSSTYSTYDLSQKKDNQLYFENKEVGEKIIIRAKLKTNAPPIPKEFQNLDEYNSTIRLYAQEIMLNFEDTNGYKYSQTIILEYANFDKVIIQPVRFLN